MTKLLEDVSNSRYNISIFQEKNYIPRCAVHNCNEKVAFTLLNVQSFCSDKIDSCLQVFKRLTEHHQ